MIKTLLNSERTIEQHERSFARKMISPTVLVLLFMSAFSIVFTLYYSFTDYYYISRKPVEWIGLGNYISLFKDRYFIISIWNTVVFTVCCTVLETVIGVLVAVFVNKLKHGRKTMRTLIMIPYLLPPVTAALIWQVLLSNNYGPVNEILASANLPVFNWFFDIRTAMPVIILIDVWQCMPFCFLLAYASLQSIPAELYEAGKIDGTNTVTELFKITLPSIRSTVILCLLLRTIDSFRMFDKINILTSGGPANTTSTVTQFIFNFGIKSLKFGFASAGALVMGIFVLFLSSFYIKGAVKK